MGLSADREVLGPTARPRCCYKSIHSDLCTCMNKTSMLDEKFTCLLERYRHVVERVLDDDDADPPCALFEDF